MTGNKALTLKRYGFNVKIKKNLKLKINSKIVYG